MVPLRQRNTLQKGIQIHEPQHKLRCILEHCKSRSIYILLIPIASCPHFQLLYIHILRSILSLVVGFLDRDFHLHQQLSCMDHRSMGLLFFLPKLLAEVQDLDFLEVCKFRTERILRLCIWSVVHRLVLDRYLLGQPRVCCIYLYKNRRNCRLSSDLLRHGPLEVRHCRIGQAQGILDSKADRQELVRHKHHNF